MSARLSCLTATYGRKNLVEEVLWCFLGQHEGGVLYDKAELIILNNNPVPLRFDHPRVRVINEPVYPTLGHCRRRLLELAEGEYVRTWDDDDLYLPWTVVQGVRGLDEAGPKFAGYKPYFSWNSLSAEEYVLAGNVFEASQTVRAEVAKRYGYRLSGGDEHAPLLDGIDKEGGLKIEEVDPSYAYRWGEGWPFWHISGSLGSDTVENRTRVWLEHHRDTGDGESPLVPKSCEKYWHNMVSYLHRTRPSPGLGGELPAVRMERLFKEHGWGRP